MRETGLRDRLIQTAVLLVITTASRCKLDSALVAQWNHLSCLSFPHFRGPPTRAFPTSIPRRRHAPTEKSVGLRFRSQKTDLLGSWESLRHCGSTEMLSD